MNVLVIQSGVVDAKWPLPGSLAASSLAAHAAAHTVSSPFDEAALEVALKLRDRDPATRIEVLVAGGEALARHAASLRADRVRRIALAEVQAWDCVALARALAVLVRAGGASPDLVLVGREFGNCDDGSVPAALAEALRMSYVGLAWGLELEDGQVLATRQRGADLERVEPPLPALVSITNHSQNRLRHPLLKNVIMTKKMVIETLHGAGRGPAEVLLDGIAAAAAAERASACRMITGSAAQQAEQLARLLLEAAA